MADRSTPSRDPAAAPAPSAGAVVPETEWSPFVPDARRPWSEALAGHLLRRAAFGASAAALRKAVETGPEAAVTVLLSPPAGADAFHREQDSYETSGSSARPLPELRGWWLRRMMLTPYPLLERMTLFWHGYFGVGSTDPDLALAHVRTLRKHALGRFDELLKAVLRDPATRLAAGGADQPRARPNEAWARNVLERFTVGGDRFTAEDVAGTARAFTGGFVRGGVLRFAEREHDAGGKTIFGRTGPWTEDDFVRLALEQPATSLRVVRALYRALVSEEDDQPDSLLEPMAASFRRDFDVGRLTGVLLRSNRFFAADSVLARVKSPVEFAVGLCRALESVVPAAQLGHDLADLGQDLYRPPTLKGWAGGRAWINPATLIGRANLVAALTAGSGRYDAGLDPAKAARAESIDDPAAAARFIRRRLLPAGDPAGPGMDLRAAVRISASSPEYQLL